MGKVIIKPEVRFKLKALIKALYDKEYFGFKADARAYVDIIIKFIYSIPIQKHRKTKDPKNGVFYCQYKHNRKTTYYISFDKEDDNYLIKHITNNHSPDYPDFIK